MIKKLWISGVPATFATKGEQPWKEMLRESIEESAGEYYQGMKLKFILPTMAPNNNPLDLDNLCEPVFSVLINNRSYFGGKRSNVIWWQAEKMIGEPTGLELILDSSDSIDPESFFYGQRAWVIQLKY